MPETTVVTLRPDPNRRGCLLADGEALAALVKAGVVRAPTGAVAYSFAGRSIRQLRALCERAKITLKVEE